MQVNIPGLTPKKTGILALVAGCVSLLIFPFLCGLIAMGLGVAGIVSWRGSGLGKGPLIMSISGFALGLINVAFALMIAASKVH